MRGVVGACNGVFAARVTFCAAFSDSASPRRATTLPSDHIPLRRYGNALVFVFMMTDVPPGSRTYKSRGWCGTRETIALSRAHLTLSVAMRAGATWSTASRGS